MDQLIKSVSDLVGEEYRRAAVEHGGAANTPHEGYALIKEEEEAVDRMSTISLNVANLWWAVKHDDLTSQRLYLSEIRTAAILGLYIKTWGSLVASSLCTSRSVDFDIGSPKKCKERAARITSPGGSYQ